MSTMSTSSLPSTMDAIRVSRLGGPEVLEYVTDEPVPTLTDGHVLVRNEYVGVNFIDIYFREGTYPISSLPFIPGQEAAGVVAAVHPSVTAFKEGDRVVYTCNNGACATYRAMPADRLIVVPENIPTQLAAASYLQGLTATAFISESAQVKKDQWVLVHAAAGGVGLLMCQILKERGAKVIGTASTEEKCALARMFGADWTVNSLDEKLVEKVKEITGGYGVDAILDGVGKATFDGNFEMAARKGTIVTFGNASGMIPPMDILRLRPKCLRLLRPLVGVYLEQRWELETHAKDLMDMLETGKLNVKIYKTYPLKEIAEAQSDLKSRKTTGKLVLKVG